ncbi:hypothetical protein NKG94_01450 [Micromonospora sp. M12]
MNCRGCPISSAGTTIRLGLTVSEKFASVGPVFAVAIGVNASSTGSTAPEM